MCDGVFTSHVAVSTFVPISQEVVDIIITHFMKSTTSYLTIMSDDCLINFHIKVEFFLFFMLQPDPYQLSVCGFDNFNPLQMNYGFGTKVTDF